MKEIDRQCIQRLEAIRAFKEAGPDQVHFMQNFMNEFVDPTAFCCVTCPSQIRFYWKRIIDWGNHFQYKIDEILATPEPIVGNLCECGNPLPDKRYKKCSDCKK